MCGRAALAASADELRDAFGLADLQADVARYNLAPSQELYAVRVQPGPEGPRRTLDKLRWGFAAFRATDDAALRPLVLARAETVCTAPAFREAIRSRRCLVAVSGFFEWKRSGAASPATPYFFRRPAGGVFALAGIWASGRAGENALDTCAILTRAAVGAASAIHDRMPVVLEPQSWTEWLDPEVQDDETLARLLAAPPPELAAYAVDPAVNDARNDTPLCIAPHEPAQRSLF